MLLTAAKTQKYLLKIDLEASIQQEKSDRRECRLVDDTVRHAAKLSNVKSRCKSLTNPAVVC